MTEPHSTSAGFLRASTGKVATRHVDGSGPSPARGRRRVEHQQLIPRREISFSILAFIRDRPQSCNSSNSGTTARPPRDNYPMARDYTKVCIWGKMENQPAVRPRSPH